MYKITRIDDLGTDYTVADQTGKIIKTIQVIQDTEILEAALGTYNETFTSVQEYLDKSIAVLEGYEEVDPYRTLWISTMEKEVILADVIQYAITYGYDRIILEHLDKTADPEYLSTEVDDEE